MRGETSFIIGFVVFQHLDVGAGKGQDFISANQPETVRPE